MSKDTDIKEGEEQGGNGNGGGSEEKTQSVQERAANTSNLESKDSGNTMQNSFYPNYKAGDASGGVQGLKLGGYGSGLNFRERVDNKRR